MSRFIKLTLLVRANAIKEHRDYTRVTEKVLMLQTEAITGISGGEGQETYVYTTGGQSFFVKESLGDIMEHCRSD